ncbi:MAG: hypothetical protein WD036_12625, partial [Bauldia sp.]
MAGNAEIGALLVRLGIDTAQFQDGLRRVEGGLGRLSRGAGVAFAADSGQFLAMSGRRDARWDYRWTLLTFRIDGSSGSADTTV